MRISCPTCHKQLEDVPSDYPTRPFCSRHCKLADLNNWLSEAYRISEPAPHSALGEASEDALSDSSLSQLHAAHLSSKFGRGLPN